LWFQKVGEFFPFFGNFFQIKYNNQEKKKKLNGHPKAFLNQNYVVLPMKIATLSTYKYF
jgi:hypothetical protein